MFCCEYCEILKNTSFEKHLRTVVSLIGFVLGSLMEIGEYQLRSDAKSLLVDVLTLFFKEVIKFNQIQGNHI